MAAPDAQILNVIAGTFAQLQPDDAKRARAAAAALGRCGVPDWLAPGKAFDLPFAAEPAVVRDAVRAVLCSLAADINTVPAAGRRKKLLIADMDSTIIGCEVVDEMAGMAGIKPKIADITERAMRGELDFPAAVRERVALLKGLPLSALARVYAERVRLNPGAKALVATMRANGAHTLLISGGFRYFTARVAADAGFDGHQGNTLLDDGTHLTGKVAEPVLGREAKRDALRRAVAERGIGLADALAVGDGANDLEMIEEAGLGVAYRAKPVVARAADASVAHGDLTALLYLQGYRGAEIVNPAP